MEQLSCRTFSYDACTFPAEVHIIETYRVEVTVVVYPRKCRRGGGKSGQAAKPVPLA